MLVLWSLTSVFRNKLLLFKPPSLWHFVIAATKSTKKATNTYALERTPKIVFLPCLPLTPAPGLRHIPPWRTPWPWVIKWLWSCSGEVSEQLAGTPHSGTCWKLASMEAWKSLPLGSAAPQNLLWTKLKGFPGKQLAAKCCWLLWTAESGATDSTRWWEHIRARKRETLPPLEGRSGSVSVVSLSPSVHKVLFEPSEPFWQVWSLILNAISPLLLSCWGFSSARGCGVLGCFFCLFVCFLVVVFFFFFFGEVQHSPIDGCSAEGCNFGVLAEDEHKSFYSTILRQKLLFWQRPL